MNKRDFRYVQAIADPTFPHSNYYRATESETYGPRIAFGDMGKMMQVDKTGLHITGNEGFRSARANVCCKSGTYYYEVKVTNGIAPQLQEALITRPAGNDRQPHVRMGFGRREAFLETGVGFDCYGYGIKDTGGAKIFRSRPLSCFPDGQNICTGDVIGLEITLPSEQLHRKIVEGSYNPAVDLEDDLSPQLAVASDIMRDRIPIRSKEQLFFELVEYQPTKELVEYRNPAPPMGVSIELPKPTHPSPNMRTLPSSSIKVYKNGVFVEEAFKDLLAFLPPASKTVPPLPAASGRDALDDGSLGYYPMVSCFYGGALELNFGPNFWFPPAGYEEKDGDTNMLGANKAKPMSERYTDQIAEDVVADLIDEIDFMFRLDGGQAVGVQASAGSSDSARGVDGMPSEELKELAQDED